MHGRIVLPSRREYDLEAGYGPTRLTRRSLVVAAADPRGNNDWTPLVQTDFDATDTRSPFASVVASIYLLLQVEEGLGQSAVVLRRLNAMHARLRAVQANVVAFLFLSGFVAYCVFVFVLSVHYS